jgi:hypothetical protein
MTDPIDEIISMSNDDTIKNQIDDSDTSDSDSEDVKERTKEKTPKFSESTKRKRKKINKKQMSKDLHKNKIRQIKIAMPYTVNTDSSNKVIDYNNSEEIRRGGEYIEERMTNSNMNGTGANSQAKSFVKSQTKVPFYKKRSFEVMIIILVTIMCSFLVMFVSIKVYKYVEYKIKTDPLNDKKHMKDKPNVDNSFDENTDTITTTNDFSDEFDKLASDIPTKNISGGKIKQNKASNGRVLPKRDARGRFVKTK